MIEPPNPRRDRSARVIFGLGMLSFALFGIVRASLISRIDEPLAALAPAAEGVMFLGLALFCFVRGAELQDRILIASLGSGLVLSCLDAFISGRGWTTFFGMMAIGVAVGFWIRRRRKERARTPLSESTPSL